MSLFHTSKTWYGNSCLLFHCIVGVHIQDGESVLRMVCVSSSVLTGPCIYAKMIRQNMEPVGAWFLCRSYGIKSVSSHPFHVYIQLVHKFSCSCERKLH